MGRKTIIVICLFLTGLLGLYGCGSPSSNYDNNYADSLQDNKTEGTLVYESSMELQYARNFSVDYYKGGYTMLTTTMDGQRFLVVPKGKEIPENMQEDIIVLQRPTKIYIWLHLRLWICSANWMV